MDAQFLVDQRDALREQLAALRSARDRLATAAMSAADEMARLERLKPGSVSEETLQRSRRAQAQLGALDEQIKALAETLHGVEDRLSRDDDGG